ncbi:MAG: hypothetical protein K6F77_08410, partial [Lachnospiraceae bacterium]|nr:hypothetical protein [Lachnospiraceae bacterium]
MFKISKRGVGVLTILSLTVALWGNVPVNNDTKAATATVDLNGTYHASLGIQTCTSIWYENLNYYKKTKTNVLSSSQDGDTAGTFTEATIAGNGTYTVSLTNAVFNNPNHKSTLDNYADEQHISQLHVATDIPDNETIKFTNLSVNINGTEVVKFEEAFMENESSYKANGMVAIALNKWRASKDKNTVLIDKMKQYNLVDETDTTVSLGGGYKLLNGTGEENITITFTVSGFSYNYGETPATATPQPSATAAPSSSSSGSGSGNTTATVSSDTALADGATATVDNLEYTVTNSSADGGTVALS